MPSKSARSPAVLLFLRVVAAVFVAEALAMFILSRLAPLGGWLETLVDSTVLALLMTPLLWRWLVVSDRQRRRADENLRLQSAALTAAANAILIANRDGTIVWVNPAFTTLTGYTLADAVGKNPRDLVKSGQQERTAYEQLWQTILAGRTWCGELINRRKDGSLYPEEQTITPVCDAAGEITHFIAIKQDLTERKQAEAVLRRAEEQYRSIFENALEGIYQTTPQGAFLAVNLKMARILGYDSPETLIRERTDIGGQGYVDPQRREEFRHRIEAEGSVSGFEYQTYRRDGSKCWVSENARVVRDAQGQVVCYEGSFDDITARRQAEAAVRESEERYRSLFENMAEGLAYCQMLFDGDRPQDFVYLAVNRAFGTLTGLKNVVDRKVTEIIPGIRESDPGLFEIYGRVARGGAPERLETYVEALKMWFALSVYCPGQDQFVAVFDVITVRKQAEVRLRQSEERYRLLFDHNPLAMWLYDSETLRFLAVNESAVRLYGYTPEEFLGMTIMQIRPPEDVPALLPALAQEGTTSSRSSECRHRRKDGTNLHVEINSRPLVFDGRQVRLVLAHDITEKKLLEAKFLHAQRLESIGMLAAGIAHDLNNVLAPIVFAAPMLRESLSTARDLKILDILEQSAGRGAGLVKQILGFAHTSTGDFRPTQVKHLARDIVSVIEETFPKSIQLEHQIPSELWLVHGNATQIHQVLFNLCINARDAMPQGGTLRIGAANRPLDAAEAQALPGARPGTWLVLEIADTGCGIAPEVLDRIWDPFFTTKSADRGTGLGLSTVRGIVASHHGFVALDSTHGHGTTFRVFLPAVASQPTVATDAPALAVPRGQGELILVVDDDQAVRDTVAAILQFHGYRVLSSGDGMEAIGLFTANPGEISLVVTDVDMPILNGSALARALLQVRPDLRVVIMSGLSRNEPSGVDVQSARDLAHAFLLKPFQAEDLLGTVHGLLHPSEKT